MLIYEDNLNKQGWGQTQAMTYQQKWLEKTEKNVWKRVDCIMKKAKIYWEK